MVPLNIKIFVLNATSKKGPGLLSQEVTRRQWLQSTWLSIKVLCYLPYRFMYSFQALSFIPFGFGSTICNIVLIAAILSCGNLRCRGEMRIICAVSIAELVEGTRRNHFFDIHDLFALCLRHCWDNIETFLNRVIPFFFFFFGSLRALKILKIIPNDYMKLIYFLD